MATTELEVMKTIDKALSGVSAPAVRDRILRWAWAKFSPMHHVVSSRNEIISSGNGKGKTRKRRTSRRRASTDLDL